MLWFSLLYLVSVLSRIFGALIYFFFFQAEDGIRDVAVTGVQTCALPIRKDMISHTKISKRQAEKLKIGRIIPREIQVMPLPIALEKILPSLSLHVIRVQVGTRVILMNVKSRQILDIIKICQIIQK